MKIIVRAVELKNYINICKPVIMMVITMGALVEPRIVHLQVNTHLIDRYILALLTRWRWRTMRTTEIRFFRM